MWSKVQRRKIASSLAVITLSLFPIAAPTQAHSTVQVSSGENLGNVTIDDTAGVINKARLRDALDDIDFYEPTNVAVYTRKGEYSDDINTKTLQYAKSVHPEWISDKPEDYGDYWADGLLIITLSVEGSGHGQVGTYFGEDRKVSTGQMEKIHEKGYSDFKLSRWTDGVIAVADGAAAIMNRPWYKAPALWWTGGIVGGLGSIFAISVVVVRRTWRRNFEESLAAGSAHLTNVTMDLDETELAARTLPTGSVHAAELERRFADFMTKYRESFDLQTQLEAADKRSRGSSRLMMKAQRFNTAAQKLDRTDDAIIAASALYTRSARWEDAWRLQTQPIFDDLSKIPELVDGVESQLERSATNLSSFRESALKELDHLTAQLTSEEIDVDQALDGLSDLRRELTKRLEWFADDQINAYAKDSEEKEKMRNAMASARRSGGDNPRGGTILDVLSPGGTYWSVGNYSTAYQAGIGSVDEARSSGGSSGISTGYSGGGSFSGAGGSSRF